MRGCSNFNFLLLKWVLKYHTMLFFCLNVSVEVKDHFEFAFWSFIKVLETSYKHSLRVFLLQMPRKDMGGAPPLPIPGLKRWATQEFHCSLNHFWKRRMWPTCNGGRRKFIELSLTDHGKLPWLGLLNIKSWYQCANAYWKIYFCLFASECPKLITNGSVAVILDLI